jgi:hypothetical protein
MERIDIEYERKMSGSYMKIKTNNEGSFDEQMLMRKRIPGLLPMEKCYMDGAGQFWYDITGKQSLDTFCRVKAVGQAFLEQLVHSVCDELGVLEQYLVDTNCLCLAPELVYVSIQTGEIIFTAVPGSCDNLADRFRELVEYLLTRVDHKDAKAVRLAYDIYEKTLEDGYSIADIQNSIVRAHLAEGSEFPENPQMKSPAGIHSGKIQTEPAGGVYSGKMLTEPTGGTYSGKTWTEPEKGAPSEKTRTELSPGSESVRKRCDLVGIGKDSCATCNEQMQLPGILAGRLPGIISRFLAAWEEKFQGGTGFWKKRTKQQKNETYGFEKRSNDKAEWRIVYPDDDPQEEIHNQIHPTICLSDYREHPEGLLLYEGYENFSNIRLEKRALQIGHSEDSDIVIAKDTISRYHARIECADFEFFLEDLNSTNGTFVNEEQLAYKEKRKLKTNDIIRFADVKYRFV